MYPNAFVVNLCWVPWLVLHKVAGGCDFVRKTLTSLVPDSVKTTVLVDLLGYDGFPALAALEASAAVRPELS